MIKSQTTLHAIWRKRYSTPDQHPCNRSKVRNDITRVDGNNRDSWYLIALAVVLEAARPLAVATLTVLPDVATFTLSKHTGYQQVKHMKQNRDVKCLKI